MTKELSFEDGLAKVLRDHRRCMSFNSGLEYKCICGEPVSSNSHHVQSRHVAEKVVAYLQEVQPAPVEEFLLGEGEELRIRG